MLLYYKRPSLIIIILKAHQPLVKMWKVIGFGLILGAEYGHDHGLGFTMDLVFIIELIMVMVMVNIMVMVIFMVMVLVVGY